MAWTTSARFLATAIAAWADHYGFDGARCGPIEAEKQVGANLGKFFFSLKAGFQRPPSRFFTDAKPDREHYRQRSLTDIRF